MRYRHRAPAGRPFSGASIAPVRRRFARASIAAAAALVLSLIAVAPLAAENGERTVSPDGGFVRYHDRTDSLLASPGALRFGLMGFVNPAMPASMHQGELAFNWSSPDGVFALDRFALYAGAPGLGFGVRSIDIGPRRVNDYRLSLAADFGALKTGLAWGWYGGDAGAAGVGRNLTAGVLIRPTSFASLGLFGTTAIGRPAAEAVADVAVRPLGTELLTVFGEYAADTGRDFPEGRWSAGAVVEPLAGLRVTGRYVADRGLDAGIQLSLARIGGSFRRTFEVAEDDHSAGTRDEYGVRVGAWDRNIPEEYLIREQRYLELDLRGRLHHRPLFAFDPTPTLYDKLDAIEKARTDPTVAGVVIDATDLRLSQSMAWEIAERLQALRDDGKRVVLYLERAGMDSLHLIASADRVVIDPEGSLYLPGFISSSTYLSQLLEAAGIGVEEFRLNRYKSTLEMFTRTEMSEADREQRQQFVDVYYETVRDRITTTRGIDGARFDEIIDYAPAVLAGELLDLGLVDEAGRYTDIDETISRLEGFSPARIRPRDLTANQRPDDDLWAQRPRIGIVYALGATQTAAGMRAREVARELRSMRSDPSVAAVVMRVDSPGGDIVASDLVADEVERTAQVKPMIVSMAGIASSGGYWISMYADRIFALPTTLTGSIGVSNGYFFDDGLSERLRLHTDSVERGDSADLLRGPTLPLIGLTLPGRSLTDSERAQYIELTERWYERFLEKSAEARGFDTPEVERIAAGRVWAGEAARDRGLVDEIGSLHAAVMQARRDAGIRDEARVEIVEGPLLPPLPPMPFPAPFEAAAARAANTLAPDAVARRADAYRVEPDDILAEYIELMIDGAGQPMAVMPFDVLHWAWREEQPSVRRFGSASRLPRQK